MLDRDHLCVIKLSGVAFVRVEERVCLYGTMGPSAQTGKRSPTPIYQKGL